MKIQWQSPKALLHTAGVSWEYQSFPEITSQMKDTLPTHFQNWMDKKTDKQLHPIYLSLSGPGTGKSRLLQEFPALCRQVTEELLKEATQDQRELLESLHQKLKHAFVFQVFFSHVEVIFFPGDL